MIMPGPRELSERTSVVTPKGTIISDKGDSGLIYTNQNGGIKRQIESFAAGSEPKEKLDSLQAKVIHTTVVEHIRKNTNSFNSPGTRMAMTLRDENMIRHQGLVDALNRPIHRETDIFSLEWAQTQPINGYEKFVTQPTNFAIIGGGNAAIHKAVENHLTKSSESSKLLNEVSEYAPRVHKVRIHDDNAKPSA